MEKEIKVKVSSPFSGIYGVFCICTAMIGYKIHHSIFWSILDFLFTPFAWLKWMIMEQVNVTIIKSAFEFFFK